MSTFGIFGQVNQSGASQTVAASTQQNTLNAAQLMALWIQAGGDPTKAQAAAAVALAESGGLINNVNQSDPLGSYGLWQINKYYHPDLNTQEAITSPLYNAQQAVAISNNGQNFNAWTSWWSNDGGKTNVGPGNGTAGQILAQLTNTAAPGATTTTAAPSTNPQDWLSSIGSAISGAFSGATNAATGAASSAIGGTTLSALAFPIGVVLIIGAIIWAGSDVIGDAISKGTNQAKSAASSGLVQAGSKALEALA